MLMDQQPIGLPRIEMESISRKVESAIREHILSGQLRPGARLVEVQLAQELGVSRAPVRAALQTLEVEGLVVTVPNKGACVAGVTARDLHEIYTVRSVLEELAVRLAAERWTRVALADLQEIVERMQEAARAGDAPMMAAFDLEFHQYLWDLSGHQRLRQILLSMMGPIRMFIALNARLYEDFSDNCLEHSELLDALQAGDVEKAGSLMAQHITDAGRLNIKFLERQASDT